MKFKLEGDRLYREYAEEKLPLCETEQVPVPYDNGRAQREDKKIPLSKGRIEGLRKYYGF